MVSSIIAQKKKKMLGRKTMSSINALGLKPPAVWVAPSTYHLGSSHLPCRVKRKSEQPCPYFSVNFVYFVFNILQHISYLVNIICSNSAQWSEPFRLSLNVCQMYTTAWRTKRLGRVNNEHFTFFISIFSSEPFLIEKVERKRHPFYPTLYSF